jgi:23S rRNA (pseudouridine1915-N3)-methyltransferase
MRKIRVICVGKTDKGFLLEGIKQYEKRLRRYCNFQFVIVKEANYSTLTPKTCLELEGERIEKLISPENITISCDEKGKLFSSKEFAEQFIHWSNQGSSQFDFIVGGAYGVAQSVSDNSNLTFSFSPLTLTHQMFRLVLIEQIYRAFTIIKGEQYHHS